MTRTVLFHRHADSLTGGQMKMRDYFDHVTLADGFRAVSYVEPSHHAVAGSLWGDETARLPEWKPQEADVLFIGGQSWDAIPAGLEDEKPVIALVQHVRYGNKGSRRWHGLKRRAIRICVSDEVADTIRATGIVNGPVHVIPNGIAFDSVPPSARPGHDVFIGGLKRPDLARRLAAGLAAAGLRVQCQTEKLPRDAFLRAMADAPIVVTLPNPTEGFFLPALEAMALGAAVVCPDCIGNRSFCRDGETALMPKLGRFFPTRGLMRAVLALHKDADLRQRLRDNGRAMAARHSLAAERAAFHALLKGV